MKYAVIPLALLLASSCATAYKDARSWEYVGNNQYLVKSDTSRYTDAFEDKKYMLFAAAEVCAKEKQMGYRLVSRDNGATDAQYTQLVQCEGPVDPVMEKKIAELTKPAIPYECAWGPASSRPDPCPQLGRPKR